MHAEKVKNDNKRWLCLSGALGPLTTVSATQIWCREAKAKEIPKGQQNERKKKFCQVWARLYIFDFT